MDEPILPASVAGVLKYLDATFPNRCPEINDSERMVWFKAGQRDVVNHLLWLQANTEVETRVLLQQPKARDSR